MIINYLLLTVEYILDAEVEITASVAREGIISVTTVIVSNDYTITIDAKKIPHRVIRVDLVTFRTSQALPKRQEGLKKYLKDAPFVLFSGRTRGGYDWITVKSFLSNEMADEENDIYRNLFGDIMQTYEVYDFVPQTEVSMHALTYTENEYKRFLKEWAPPFIGS